MSETVTITGAGESATQTVTVSSTVASGGTLVSSARSAINIALSLAAGEPPIKYSANGTDWDVLEGGQGITVAGGSVRVAKRTPLGRSSSVIATVRFASLSFSEMAEDAGVVTSVINPVTGGIEFQANGANQLPAALDSLSDDVTASRALTLADRRKVLKCTHATVAIVLTIPNDATAGWSRNEVIAAYQGGAAAVSFAADTGNGVTLRGTAPTAAQYSTHGVMRVGANEWAYL